MLPNRYSVKHDVHSSKPVLDTCFSADGTIVFSGGCDKAVRMWRLEGQPQAHQIGIHDKPVKSVGFLKATNLVVSGGWDGKVMLWDGRTPPNPVRTINMPERVYSKNVRGNLIVVATAGPDRQVLAYDLTQPQQPREILRKESPLDLQTRCVTLFPDLTGYAIGSIEGRMGIQVFQPTVANNKSFKFKCHRKIHANQTSDVYAVNAIAFWRQDIFATGGSDGVITFWDKGKRNRLSNHETGRPITCASFNKDGSLFAYGSSYDWSKGSSFYDQRDNAIIVHSVTEDDVTGKK